MLVYVPPSQVAQTRSSIADGALVISIPYIPTNAEIRRRRRNLIIVAAVFLMVLLAAGAVAYFFMPPPELMLAKLRVLLSRH